MRRIIPPALAALAVAALTLYAYRGLPERPFAADDYQWLLNVRGLGLAEVARRAFDAGAQSHFYRPLVWLLFWAEARAFDLDPRGYHAVTLALHLLCAGLTGALISRLQIADFRFQIGASPRQSTIYNLQSAIPILGMGFVALHPAPFEAVTWISAQSELLAAALLLLALHLWLRPVSAAPGGLSAALSPRRLLATLALGLALLAKESAVIGLPLLMLVDWSARQRTEDRGQETADSRQATTSKHPFIFHFSFFIFPFAPMILLTLAYLALQAAVETRNYLLREGGYGFGPQVLLNPLRALALVVAPLPGTEHADNAWLVPLGALVALALALLLARGPRRARPLVLALLLTLLPTAPFAAPPNSRYLYLPVIAAALLVGMAVGDGRWARGEGRCARGGRRSQFSILNSQFSILAVGGLLVIIACWWSAGELRAREERFAAGTGPGGSLWRLATEVCASAPPERVVVVEPPLPPQIAEAIVALACGHDVRARVVGRDGVARAVKGRSVVIEFPNGSAQVTRRT